MEDLALKLLDAWRAHGQRLFEVDHQYATWNLSSPVALLSLSNHELLTSEQLELTSQSYVIDQCGRSTNSQLGIYGHNL